MEFLVRSVVVFPLRAKYDFQTRTLEGIEGQPFEADPDQAFSELQEGPLEAPFRGEPARA